MEKCTVHRIGGWEDYGSILVHHCWPLAIGGGCGAVLAHARREEHHHSRREQIDSAEEEGVVVVLRVEVGEIARERRAEHRSHTLEEEEQAKGVG